MGLNRIEAKGTGTKPKCYLNEVSIVSGEEKKK